MNKIIYTIICILICIPLVQAQDFDVYTLPTCNDYFVLKVLPQDNHTFTMLNDCKLDNEVWKTYRCNCPEDNKVSISADKGIFGISIQYYVTMSKDSNSMRVVNINDFSAYPKTKFNLPNMNYLVGILFIIFAIIFVGIIFLFKHLFNTEGKIDEYKPIKKTESEITQAQQNASEIQDKIKELMMNRK